MDAQGHDDEISASSAALADETAKSSSERSAPAEATGGTAICFCMEVRYNLYGNFTNASICTSS